MSEGKRGVREARVSSVESRDLMERYKMNL